MSSQAEYSPNDRIYWAAEERDKIAGAIKHRFDRYQDRTVEDGRLEVWRTADTCYHGRNPDGGYATAHRVTFAGTSGEVAQLHVGHFRQIVGAQLTIATEQRPAIECTATSNDPEAISETIVARQVLEYDLDEGGLEQDFHDVHERALVYSEGYVVQEWDFHAGQLVGTKQLSPELIDLSGDGLPEAANDNGKALVAMQGTEVPVHEGEVAVHVRAPVDVARDLDAADGEPEWYIVRFRRNRWKLAARFPEDGETRDAILDAPGAPTDDWALWPGKARGAADSDFIHTLVLYHPPTDALPQGRLAEVLTDGHTWVSDDPYPYDHMVVHADVPSRELGCATGYGDSWEMLAPSQALDAVESGILTVADAGSLVRYKARRGSKVDVRQLDTGLTLSEFDDNGLPNEQGPELMERPEVRASDFQLTEHYRQTLEIISGVNATVRGAAESEVKSGADRALIATMAVRANSKHQRALAKVMRSVLNGRVKLYKTFATEDRMVEIAGRDKSGHVATFSAKTFESIRRVRVELGPADLRTVEGKIALADKMLEAYGPEVVTPDRYLALRTTGRVDDIDNSIAEHKVNARRENDMCRQGQGAMLQAILTDHHACHIREHVRELNDPAIRFDASRLQQAMALMQHITEHGQLWAGCPPELLAATGQDPAPSTLMGPPGGAPPMGAGGPPMPANDNGQPPGAPPMEVGMDGPGLPQMPMVPGTDQRFSPAAQPPGGPQ